MRLVRGLDAAPAPARGTAVTIGNFDGVHLGHQALIHHTRRAARRLEAASAVVTFEPLPGEYFAPDKAPPRLTRCREKLPLLERAGTELTWLLRFNSRFSGLEPDAFAERVLARGLRARHVTVGPDFRFGHARRGDAELLAALGQRLGFDVSVHQPVQLDGERVSSSAVRAALAGGRLERAAALLGRPYAMSGRVVHGDGIGRDLGYPTANVDLGRRRAPLRGVFAVRVRGYGPDALPGVASLGTRPTVGGREECLEVHVFDFDADLYGRRLEVAFEVKLRDETHFPSVAALTRQMARDAEAARRLLEQRAG